MNKPTYMIYWTNRYHEPHSVEIDDLTLALKEVEKLRKSAAQHELTYITMVSENVDRVGKDGVDEVKDGKTPDGIEYDWNKSGRIGKVKRSERDVLIDKKDVA